MGVEGRMLGRARLTCMPAVKSMLVNKAVQDIGMGRYNWQLFVLCGFGWFADKYVFPVLLSSYTGDAFANQELVPSLWMQVRQFQARPCGDSPSVVLPKTFLHC